MPNGELSGVTICSHCPWGEKQKFMFYDINHKILFKIPASHTIWMLLVYSFNNFILWICTKCLCTLTWLDKLPEESLSTLQYLDLFKHVKCTMKLNPSFVSEVFPKLFLLSVSILRCFLGILLELVLSTSFSQFILYELVSSGRNICFFMVTCLTYTSSLNTEYISAKHLWTSSGSQCHIPDGRRWTLWDTEIQLIQKFFQ
jgi:hypothetical protein